VKIQRDSRPADLDVIQATQLGRVTTLVVECVVGDRTYRSAGSSVCDQHDVPDDDLGFRLALGRAVVDLGREIKHEAWGDVTRTPAPVDDGFYSLETILGGLRENRRATLVRLSRDRSVSKKLRRAAKKELAR